MSSKYDWSLSVTWNLLISATLWFGFSTTELLTSFNWSPPSIVLSLLLPSTLCFSFSLSTYHYQSLFFFFYSTVQSSFSVRNKRLAPAERKGVIVGAVVRLCTDVGDHAGSEGSSTLSSIGLKLLLAQQPALHDHSLLQSDGSDLTVIAKVTIGRRTEKYR